jgi:hypothetical protein
MHSEAPQVDRVNRGHIGIDHQPSQVRSVDVRLPPQFAVGLAGVADQRVHLGRAQVPLVEADSCLSVAIAATAMVIFRVTKVSLGGGS